MAEVISALWKNQRCTNLKFVLLELITYLGFIKPDYNTLCHKATFGQFLLYIIFVSILSLILVVVHLKAVTVLCMR